MLSLQLFIIFVKFCRFKFLSYLTLCLLAKMKLTEDDEEEVATDMEGLITFYCKSRGEKYRSSSGLVEIMSPFITLNLPLSEVYNCFYAMQTKFIPRYILLFISKYLLFIVPWYLFV